MKKAKKFRQRNYAAKNMMQSGQGIHKDTHGKNMSRARRKHLDETRDTDQNY